MFAIYSTSTSWVAITDPQATVTGSPFSGVRDISQVTTHRRTFPVVRALKRKHVVLGEHL